MTMDEDRAKEGVEHLQAAAREIIAAGRAFFDAMEGLVDSSEAGRSVRSLFDSMTKGEWGPPRRGEPGGSNNGGDEGYTHIKLD
jgi:hypothetical protein